MKVWIVEHEGKIVGASTDEVEACQYALIAGGYSRDAVANATLDGIVEAVESIGATVRQVDIAALERVAEAAREMVAGIDEWAIAVPGSEVESIAARRMQEARKEGRDALYVLDGEEG